MPRLSLLQTIIVTKTLFLQLKKNHGNSIKLIRLPEPSDVFKMYLFENTLNLHKNWNLEGLTFIKSYKIFINLNCTVVSSLYLGRYQN